ncbi:GIY-YIG nuclease family protein [candidate division KSB1 bacterium]|nr:GIY-YIG nuclease family protein [candidate division KSB1 bacterium]
MPAYFEKKPNVYILASKRNGTLYVGVTSNLANRILKHKSKMYAGFTKKYSVTKLVYYEFHSDMITAITREKQLKDWHRQWKIDLIEKLNPNWDVLWHPLM